MKKVIVFLSSFFFYSLSFAQIDVLQVPSVQEKLEVNRIIGEYQKFMQVQGDSTLPKEKKALATLKFNKELINSDVQVYVDFDSTKDETSYMKIFPYATKFIQLYPQTVNTTISDISLSNVKFDKIRKYYFIEAKANKRFEWKRLRTVSLKDSLTLKDSIVSDTVKYGFNKKITFYIRFDRLNNISKNFKLFAISKQGVEPKLEALPPLVVWWLEIDPQWKNYFKSKVKIDDYPTSYEIERVTSFKELDISNSKFQTIEPLRKMPWLRKLNVSNTPITSLEMLSELTNLTELDISKTQITSLNGIEKLVNLTELKCPGLKLTSIEPLRNLTALIKLDCSENDLEDISPIKDLINLKEFDCSLNIKIKTIEPIKGLVNLEKLSFSKIDARTLEPLRGLVNLVHLNCYNTNITSLEPIRGLQKLMFLDIDHNKVTTLEPIKDYKFLAYLRISSTNIVDFSPLRNYTFLRELDISNNPQITDLGPVHKLEYIKVLKCFYTKVSKEEVARFKKNHPDCQITFYY